MTRVTRSTAWTVAFAVAFMGWSWLTLRTSLFAALDATSDAPGVSLATGWGQLTAALSFLLHPWVSYGLVLAGAAWAYRRRLRNLAFAAALAIPLSWGGEWVLKRMLRRPRPDTLVPLVTGEGWAYPSGHVTAVTTLIALALAASVVVRHSGWRPWALRAGAVALWAVVAYNRWALRAHYLTDIVGGTLWGGFAAALALLAGGVHVVLPWAGRPAGPATPPTVAVIVNPTKVPDWQALRRHVGGAARAHGWGRPRWLETTPDDPGRGLAGVAAASGVDLVLIAGGDGTVRSVLAGLAGTDVTAAILPAGTGNLLARNLGVPLDLDDALEVAFDGVRRPLDLIAVSADGGEPEGSVVMAGMGVDAVIMSETNADLKRVVGPAAYAVAAVPAMSLPPFAVRVTSDDGRPQRTRVGLALVANVGQLQAGFTLLPDARPDDGRLDVLLAGASGPVGWAGLAGRLATGRSQVEGVRRSQAERVVFETDEPVPYQLDGDPAGECRRLEASVVPDALSVMVPASASGPLNS